MGNKYLQNSYNDVIIYSEIKNKAMRLHEKHIDNRNFIPNAGVNSGNVSNQVKAMIHQIIEEDKAVLDALAK